MRFGQKSHWIYQALNDQGNGRLGSKSMLKAGILRLKEVRVVLNVIAS